MSRLTAARSITLMLLVTATPGCGPSLTADECGSLLDRYTELLARQSQPKLRGDEVIELQLAARKLAKLDPQFTACPNRVSRRQFDCAMKAWDADALERCLP